MDLNWIESILYGLFAGLTDILPVSAPAHKRILLSLFGETSEPVLLSLMIHLATLAALYYSCQKNIVRMTRAVKLAKVPKRKRKRPLDTQSLMDLDILKMMLLPVVIGFFFYPSASSLVEKLPYVAAFLLVNGVIVYIPQFLPGCNKDSRSMSRVEGFLMGLGGALSVLPGISGMGAVLSVGRMCGAENKYTLDMALLLGLPMTLGLIVFDLIALFASGATALSFLILLSYLLAAAAAFGGVLAGVWILRELMKHIELSIFAYYCWGAALFTFILFLNI